MSHKKTKFNSGNMPFSVYKGPQVYGNEKCVSTFGDGGSGGNGYYFDMGNPSDLNFVNQTDTYSISAWVNIPSTLTLDQYLVSKTTTTHTQFSIRIDASTGFLHLSAGDTFPGGNTVAIDYRDDSWHHICFNVGLVGWVVYVDGIARQTGTVGTANALSTDITLCALHLVGFPTRMWTGLIDEISFWSTQLSLGEVTELYNSGKPTDLSKASASSNLITWLRMGDGVGDTLKVIVDQIGSNNADRVKANTPPGVFAIETLTPADSIFVYPYGSGYEITNLHEDTYGGIKDAPMQGPFTYQYVGGNQHRHVPLNKGSDTIITRPELFDINFSSSGEITVTNPANSYLTPMESAEVVVSGTSFIRDVALDLDAGKIYWSDSIDNDIKRADLSGDNEEIIVSGLNTPRGIALDIAASKIYWVDSGTEKIQRANTSVAATPEDLIDLSSEATVLESIALDIDANKMYWTDRGTDTIRRANMEVGATVEDLITSGYSFPSGIRLDISAGKMYWADFSVGISRADLDGDNVEILMEVGNPYGIALDVSAGKMYWTDYTDQVVRRSNLDGTVVETLISPTTNEASLGIALDIDAGKMYWGENSTEDNIKRANMSPYFPASPVPYTRGEVAKRPVNIANHKTYNPLGNYSSSYEIVQTTGRTSNNRSFVEAEGVGFIGDPSLPYSGSLVTQFVSGARDFTTGTALPTFTRSESVFVNRFNAPGGPGVSSRGVLDTYAEEFAPNNAMPWRNNAVRSQLRSDLSRHTPKATDISPVPTCHVEGFEQSTPSASTGDADLMWYGNYSSSLDWYNGAQVPRPPVTGTLSAPYGFLRRQGTVTTANTGPAGAAVGTYYAYAESSMGNASYWGPQGIGGPNIFYAISSSIGSGLLSQMSFSYFMYGADMDTPGMEAFLNVSASLDGVTWNNLELDANGVSTYNIVGQQQTGIYDSWRQAGVHLGAYADKPNVWVKIVARTGDGTYSDIAIDQIVLTTKVEQCPTHFPTKYHTDNRNTRYYKQTPPQESVQDLVATGAGTVRVVALDTCAGQMYWNDSTAGKIFRATLDGTGVEELVTGLSNVQGMALDTYAGKMYWTDSDDDKIQRANLDGTVVENVITSLNYPISIALDIDAGQMYWTDFSGGKIKRAAMELGASVEELITGLIYPNGIALDTGARKMYWVDQTGVKKANIDGTEIEFVFEHTFTGTTAARLALDTSLGKVYWTDTTLDKIQRANLDGTEVEDLITGLPFPDGIALDIDAGQMYWTDANEDKIQRANMPEKPLYDNGFVTHAIPQCSLQYSWIKASAITDRTQLLGYQNSGSY